MVNISNEISLSQNNAVCGNMDERRDCHSEWSKSDRDRQISYNIAYMWNLTKEGIDELIYKTRIELQMEKTNLWLPGCKQGTENVADWGWHINTTIYKTDNK